MEQSMTIKNWECMVKVSNSEHSFTRSIKLFSFSFKLSSTLCYLCQVSLAVCCSRCSVCVMYVWVCKRSLSVLFFSVLLVRIVRLWVSLIIFHTDVSTHTWTKHCGLCEMMNHQLTVKHLIEQRNGKSMWFLCLFVLCCCFIYLILVNIYALWDFGSYFPAFSWHLMKPCNLCSVVFL